MTYMTPAEFYQANIGKEKEYVRTYPAYEVKAGEEVIAGNIKVTAPEDGYIFEHNEEIMSAAEFAAKTSPAEDLELPVSKADLDKRNRRSIKPKKKGEELTLGWRTSTLRHDGFSFTNEGLEGFLTNLQLTSRFNYAGEKYVSEKETLVTLNDEVPVRGIMFDEKTVLLEKTGPYVFSRGDLLYPDPNTENGYSIAYGVSNTRLRLSEDCPSPHKTAAERQKRLKALAHPAPQ